MRDAIDTRGGPGWRCLGKREEGFPSHEGYATWMNGRDVRSGKVVLPLRKGVGAVGEPGSVKRSREGSLV